jgi:hypothetical protein
MSFGVGMLASVAKKKKKKKNNIYHVRIISISRMRRISFTRIHISSFEGNPLGRAKDVPSTLMGWGWGHVSCGKQGRVGSSSKGCTNSIRSMFLI